MQVGHQVANGVRRPTRKTLYSAARRAGLDALAQKLGLSAEELAENILAQSQVRTPYDELISPLDTAESFTSTLDDSESIPESLRQPAGALAGARELLAQVSS